MSNEKVLELRSLFDEAIDTVFLEISEQVADDYLTFIKAGEFDELEEESATCVGKLCDVVRADIALYQEVLKATDPTARNTGNILRLSKPRNQLVRLMRETISG